MGCCCAKLERRVNEKFHEGQQIIAKEIYWANLRYQRNTGCCQVQGNGALILTSDVLWFNLLCPNKEIEMPLRNIRSVEAAFYMNPVLIVDYVDANSGMEDQVIFALREPHFWKRKTEEAIYNIASQFNNPRNGPEQNFSIRHFINQSLKFL